jgi:hypothetical protein
MYNQIILTPEPEVHSPKSTLVAHTRSTLTRDPAVLLTAARRGQCGRRIVSVSRVETRRHAQAVTQRCHAQQTWGRSIQSGEGWLRRSEEHHACNKTHTQRLPLIIILWSF